MAQSTSSRLEAGLTIFSERLAEDRLIQAQLRDHAFELPVLLAQLSQLAQITDVEPRELLLPLVERGLIDLQLSADVAYGRAALGVPQRLDDLLVREPAGAHDLNLIGSDPRSLGQAANDVKTSLLADQNSGVPAGIA